MMDQSDLSSASSGPHYHHHHTQNTAELTWLADDAQEQPSTLGMPQPPPEYPMPRPPRPPQKQYFDVSKEELSAVSSTVTRNAGGITKRQFIEGCVIFLALVCMYVAGIAVGRSTAYNNLDIHQQGNNNDNNNNGGLRGTDYYAPTFGDDNNRGNNNGEPDTNIGGGGNSGSSEGNQQDSNSNTGNDGTSTGGGGGGPDSQGGSGGGNSSGGSGSQQVDNSTGGDSAGSGSDSQGDTSDNQGNPASDPETPPQQVDDTNNVTEEEQQQQRPGGDNQDDNVGVVVDIVDDNADEDENEYYVENPTDITVGVYYYPWHGNNFHNGDGYLRDKLLPRQEPELGEYDDSEPAVIKQHLAWSRQANINLWVASWWGPNRIEDSNIKDVILPHHDIGDLQVAIHYETTGRIKASEGYTTQRVAGDIEYLCENYFDHPNYYRIDGRPVLVLYLTRKLDVLAKMVDVVTIMRTVSQEHGHDIYIVGDHVFNDAPTEEEKVRAFNYLDAVTNYDVYGNIAANGLYAGANTIDRHFTEQGKWKARAKSNNCGFIPSVSPGYNDRGVRLDADHLPLSRKLTPDSEPGSLFRYTISKAIHYVDSDVNNLIFVNSFNEWHEDSQIEPVIGPSTTSVPELLTKGVEYEPYGDLYLDILREGTTTNVFQETAAVAAAPPSTTTDNGSDGNTNNNSS